MERRHFPNDLTDEQWQIFELLVQRRHSKPDSGRQKSQPPTSSAPAA
jgi:hypothetical protein